MIPQHVVVGDCPKDGVPEDVDLRGTGTRQVRITGGDLFATQDLGTSVPIAMAVISLMSTTAVSLSSMGTLRTGPVDMVGRRSSQKRAINSWLVLHRVEADKAGKAVLFFDELMHDGEALEEGSPPK